MFKRIAMCAVIVFISSAVYAQSLTVRQKFADAKNKFSISYVKGFTREKTAQSVSFTSADKALSFNVKVYTADEAARIAKKAGKETAETLDILKAVLEEQGVTKDLDPQMNNLPESLLSQPKAAAGSAVKYDFKKGQNRYECRAIVYSKGSSFISISYTILSKRTNEKYEKPANEMIKSFTFTE